MFQFIIFFFCFSEQVSVKPVEQVVSLCKWVLTETCRKISTKRFVIFAILFAIIFTLCIYVINRIKDRTERDSWLTCISRRFVKHLREYAVCSVFEENRNRVGIFLSYHPLSYLSFSLILVFSAYFYVSIHVYVRLYESFRGVDGIATVCVVWVSWRI